MTTPRCWLWLFLSFSVCAAAQGQTPEPPKEFRGLPLVFFTDFENGEISRFDPVTPAAWKLVKTEGNQFYSQFKHVEVKTPVRSPFNRCVIKDLIVSDCVLDVRLQTTARDYPHRSLCLFFGYQDPAHMYYVHLGQKADDHANQIFIVNNEPRKKISLTSTDGTPWDNAWHRARILREVESGKIEVYFDDLGKPVMTAIDKTFSWGQVGIGSFDDTGNFDDLTVYGTTVKKP